MERHLIVEGCPGDLIRQAVSERSRAFHDATCSILNESHPAGLMTIHLTPPCSHANRLSGASEAQDGAEPMRQFPLQWPAIPPETPHNAGIMATGSKPVSGPGTGSARSMTVPSPEEQRDLALWYGSLMTLSPTESRVPTGNGNESRGSEEQQDATAGASAATVIGTAGNVGGMGPVFELCMCKSSAEDLVSDLQLLDLSKAAASEAAALCAVKVSLCTSSLASTMVESLPMHHMESSGQPRWA